MNPAAIHLITAELDANLDSNKINWSALSSNTAPEAISILESNIDKINWDCLSANPAIFKDTNEYVLK
jgi:hypothetical protein